MSETPDFKALIEQLEGALHTASRLKSKLVVELLRMAVLAAHERAEAAKSDREQTRYSH